MIKCTCEVCNKQTATDKAVLICFDCIKTIGIAKFVPNDVCPKCNGDLRWPDGIVHAKLCQKCFMELMDNAAKNVLLPKGGECNG